MTDAEKNTELKPYYKLSSKGVEEYKSLRKVYVTNILYYLFAGGAITYAFNTWAMSPLLRKSSMHSSHQKTLKLTLAAGSLSYFIYRGRCSSDAKLAKGQLAIIRDPTNLQDEEQESS